MIGRGITFRHGKSFVPISDSFKAELYVNEVVLTVVWQLVTGCLGSLFQQDNARLHITTITLNSVDGIDMLPRSAASPDLFLKDYVWHLIGRALHRTKAFYNATTKLVHTVEQLRATADLAWQGVAQVTINGIFCSVPLILLAHIVDRKSHN